MSENGKAAGGGITFPSLLGIVFIILKLTKVIAWPWLWVLSPFWIPIIIVIVLAIIFIIFKLK